MRKNFLPCLMLLIATGCVQNNLASQGSKIDNSQQVGSNNVTDSIGVVQRNGDSQNIGKIDGSPPNQTNSQSANLEIAPKIPTPQLSDAIKNGSSLASQPTSESGDLSRKSASKTAKPAAPKSSEYAECNWRDHSCHIRECKKLISEANEDIRNPVFSRMQIENTSLYTIEIRGAVTAPGHLQYLFICSKHDGDPMGISIRR